MRHYKWNTEDKFCAAEIAGHVLNSKPVNYFRAAGTGCLHSLLSVLLHPTSEVVHEMEGPNVVS